MRRVFKLLPVAAGALCISRNDVSYCDEVISMFEQLKSQSRRPAALETDICAINAAGRPQRATVTHACGRLWQRLEPMANFFETQ